MTEPIATRCRSGDNWLCRLAYPYDLQNQVDCPDLHETGAAANRSIVAVLTVDPLLLVGFFPRSRP